VQAVYQPAPTNFVTSSGMLSGGQAVSLPAGNNTFVFTPDALLPVLDITLNGSADGTLGAGGTITVSGGSSVNQVEINGVNQAGTSDAFTIGDTSVTYNTPGFAGTVINFGSNITTRDVFATAGNAKFTIVGPGNTGPAGSLYGGNGGDGYIFANGARLRGNINPQGGAGNTLDLSAYTTGITVNLGTKSASPVRGQLLGNFATILGGSGNDVLTANNTGVTLVGNAGTNSLTGGATDRVVEATAAGATLTNTQLIFGLITDKLSGITTVNLTDRSMGHNAFIVSGWSHAGTLTGTTEVVAASKSANFTLSNSTLASTDGMSLGLSGFTTANLTATGSGHTATVSGWTGGGSLAGSAETVTAAKNAGYTLTNLALGSTDGMSLALSGVNKANLTDTRGGQTMTLNNWTGSGTLTAPSAAPDTLTVSANASYTLTNTSLGASSGLTIALVNFVTAYLTDSGSGHVFTTSGWTGGGSLTGSADTVTAVKKAGDTLSSSVLSSTDGMNLVLSGVTTANLTDTSGGKTLNVSGWTGGGTLTGTATDIVSATKNGYVRLTNTTLSSSDGMSLVLSGFKSAGLAAGAGNVSFDVGGWTGNATLTGGAGLATVVATKAASMTLTNTLLTATDSLHAVLSGVAAAQLGVNTAATGGNYTITASSYTGSANLLAYGSGNATLLGSLVSSTLTIAAGDTGNNLLIGSAQADVLTDNGTGRNILIGGLGADTLTGNGNDILVSGTTSYGTNLTALDAILAEWSSTDSYTTRIARIKGGIVVSGKTYALNSTTVQDDLATNLVQDLSGSTGDWFLVTPRDSVTSQAGEEVDVV
jgi:hypothetical protein